MKEKLYNFIANGGVKFLQTVFPEYFQQEPLGATDRYIEYPFVLKNMPKKGTVLDVGCSGSMFPLLLNAIGFDIYGIDIRVYPVLNKFSFIQSSITESHLESNFFDVVTAVSTIEHIGLKGRYGVRDGSSFLALREIHRILKPNGIFLMTVPFGKEYKETKNHRIYNEFYLGRLLKYFSFTYRIEKSPEADYDLALIKAVK